MTRMNFYFHVTAGVAFRGSGADAAGPIRACGRASGVRNVISTQDQASRQPHTLCLATPMKLNTPLPQPLPKECMKAARICE